MADVKLHGFWCSSFSHRVEWALKLKGVAYEYVEENLQNKSEELLKYNPVYEKIPVLVHGGNPIAESLVILEYIEETWPHNPLLPEDPYERAMARFWMQYSNTVGPKFHAFFIANTEEEKEKAGNEVFEVLKILEEKAIGNDDKFFGGDRISLIDISYGYLTRWLEVAGEVVSFKVLEPSKLPRLCAWAQNFIADAVIKENLVDYDRMLAHLTSLKQKYANQ